MLFGLIFRNFSSSLPSKNERWHTAIFALEKYTVFCTAKCLILIGEKWQILSQILPV
jgi:hypothetical protein